MNTYTKKISILFASLALLAAPGCKKSFLDSNQLSVYAPETSLNNVAAMRAALAACAQSLRGEFFGDSAPMLTESIFSDVAVEGTTDKSTPAQDLITRITPDANLNSDDTNKIGWYWDQEYRGIRYANTIITNIDRPVYASEAEKNAILGAAYFFRACHYYRLVHQFGDVPLLLRDLDAPRTDFYSTKRDVILQKMKEDLEFASRSVTDAGNRGEATKGAVDHLLTKVNLALGKFDDALASANAVINSGKYAVMTSRFGSTAGDATKNVVWDMHRMDNKAISTNKETLFLVIDRETLPAGFTANGSQLMRNTVPAWHFANVKTPSGATAITDAVTAEIPLTRMYGRGIGRYRGTPYSTKYIWTDNTDYRHAKGMWMEMTDLVYNNPALKTSNNAADRALYGKPLEEWNASNVRARFTNGALDTIRHWFGWPHYKVFINSTNALANDPYWTPPRGTNTDWYVFRLAETYLLRAEAQYWKGNLAAAMADVNVVRARANARPLTDPGAMTIGTILDERARELYWEEPRKTELTRIAYIFALTGKTAYNGKTYSQANFSDNNFFYDRIIEKNDFYRNQVPTLQGVNFRIAPYHVLWPIPAAVQRLNSDGRINQNKGYAGYESNVPPLDKIQ
ncbi:RagB/SusD family nutrient uptake outer membrane protein [Pedobacter yulinensis]|uniref:RagB/SusD family nutrient uptake outer membrane protein n=1 Tax=Pedobacter yulinensis TaxID=2126353 RepID=A0A2T3HQS6_9SPHI|nr:RagB/SusD family nutrient uptake outer membrane protein [Pedobacter yulinensis]PST84751.1 RagB/SusD family nutrient uptake outer membrane protein [Pedobacter yulinensis]